jgi:hypothetical protein
MNGDRIVNGQWVRSGMSKLLIASYIEKRHFLGCGKG